MASQFPCPDSLSGCDCLSLPARNFSSEQSDVPVNFCQGIPLEPPPLGVIPTDDCFVICETVADPSVSDGCDVITQGDGFLCYYRESADCIFDPRPPFDPPFPPFFQRHSNSFQSCTVECPDGTTFQESVDAGTVVSAWQADADARARALACKRAQQKKVCFLTDATLTPICANLDGTVTFEVAGGTAPYTYAHTGGSLPVGMAFDSNGTIFGTPTTGQTASFEITVTDAIGSTQIKDFTLRIIEMASPTALPDGTQNGSYNYTLLAAVTSHPVTWSIVSGQLPLGLTLNDTTGILSTAPGIGILEAGDFAFRLRVTDGTGVECEKNFTLHVSNSILGYWAFENITGPVGSQIVEDSSSNNFDLAFIRDFGPALGSLPVVAGKINNGVAIPNTASRGLSSGANAFATPSQGFTVAGWLKVILVDPADRGALWNAIFATGPIILSIDDPGDSLIFSAAAPAFSISTPYPADGQWHFVRSWYDGTSMNLQLDNGTITQVVVAMSDSQLTDFRLGFANVFVTADARSYDELGFWPRALSDAESDALWNGGAGITWGDPNMPP